MLVIVIIGITVLIAVASRLIARQWFERANLGRLQRNSSGVIVGAEAIELRGDGDAGLLLVHGFGDTPQTLRAMAEHLHSLGYSVQVPLLTGHGRSLPEFVQSSATQWVEDAQTAFNDLRRHHARVGIVGLSMGGAIAVIVARQQRDVRALALLSPYLTMPGIVRGVAKWPRAIGWLLPYFPGLGERSIRDPQAATASLAYGALNAKVLGGLAAIVDRGASALPELDLPVLMIQSRQDNRIPAVAAARTFEQIGSGKKEIIWMDNSGHVITVDRERDQVMKLVADWLSKTLPLGERTSKA